MMYTCGLGQTFILSNIRLEGELYNQVVVFKSSQYTEENEKTDQWGTPEEMDRVFAGTCELVQNAISFIQRQRRWPMYDRLPIDNWTKGRITLMGDAAHPMLQYLAQGACQALEDAAYLSDMLHKHGNDIEQAFWEYQEERIPRTANVQTSARMWGNHPQYDRCRHSAPRYDPCRSDG